MSDVQQIKDYMNRRPHWKKVWQVTSGSIKNISAAEIEKCLENNKQFLLDGILQYTLGYYVSEQTQTDGPDKPSTKAQAARSDATEKSSDSNLSHASSKSSIGKVLERDKLLHEDMGQESKRDNFKKIMERLANYLKVGNRVTWKIFTSYIMYEYCGSLKAFEKLKYEMHILPMLNNIWKFYTSERMFKIKILKSCLEFMNKPDHPYAAVYRRFIYDLGLRNIWNSLVKQLKFLINEVTTALIDKETPLKMWLERNAREQIELLQCLIILIDYVTLKLPDFQEMLLLFKTHGFGKQPTYYEGICILDYATTEKLHYTEVSFLLCMSNVFWTETSIWPESDEEEDIDDDMAALVRFDEHAPVVFLWVMMHMVLPNAIELFNSKYNRWTEKILSTGVFRFYYVMLKNDLFEPSSSIGLNVREAMYHLMVITFDKFSQDDSILLHPGVLELISELLKTPHIAQDFYEHEDKGLMPLWAMTLLLFPYKFTTVAMLGEALCSAKPEYVEVVMKEIEVLKYYTILKSDDPSKNKPPHHVGKYSVVRRLSFIEEYYEFKDWITITYNNARLMKYNKDNNFWFEFLERMNLALEVGSDINSMMSVLVTGLKFTATVAQQEEHSIEKYPYLRSIVKACINMFIRFNTEGSPPLRALALCLDVFSGVIKNYRLDLVPKLDTHRLLPSLTREVFQYHEMWGVGIVIPGLIGNIILASEKKEDQHYLVIAFLNFLRTSMQVYKGQYLTVELPGVIFILKHIYPNFLVWYSNNDAVIKEVLYQCIHVMYETFQFSEEQLQKDPIRYQMHIMTLCSLLDENGARILLKMLVTGSNCIQYLMEQENNWFHGPGIKYISTIQMILSLLLQVLELRKQIPDYKRPFPLENFIYSENNNLRVIKAVANLLNHPFNNNIPNLACRLLKKFTLELNTSMLASLEMEPDQVRMIFLQRLRDNFECEELKEAIIELITAGISCQSGMTEAFFTAIGSEEEQIAASKEKKTVPKIEEKLTDKPNLNLNESVGNFMVEYLMKATSDGDCLRSPLFLKIMELFHILWMNQKEMLIKDLINDEHFWPSLCCPLFKEICFENKMYAQIFNIITKEIHKNHGKISVPLEKVLETFFSCDENYVDTWLEHIFKPQNFIEEIKVIGRKPSLLNAWKNFVIVAVKFMPYDFFSSPYKIRITNVCRKTLKDHLMVLEDNNTIVFCAELYLFLMSHWGHVYHLNSEILYEDIINMLHKVAISYRSLPKKLQTTMLAVAAVSFKSLKKIIPDNFIATNTLVESIIQIFNHEYEILHEYYKTNTLHNFSRKTHQGYFIVFAILNELITAPESDLKADYMFWLNNSEIFKIIFACAGILASNVSTIILAKDALDTILIYITRYGSINFIDKDVALQVWVKFLPPHDLFRPSCLGMLQPIPYVLKHWWKIYKRLLMIFTVLLKKYRHRIISEVLMFVTLHQEYLREILLLVINTVDFYALDLVLITLNLLYEILPYRDMWIAELENNYRSTIDALRMTLQCSAALIIRPNILKYFTLTQGQKATVSDSVPEGNLIKLMDMLTNIVTMSCHCLLRISPPIYSDVTDNRDYSYWELYLDNHFGLPKLGSSDLTFGTLLCLCYLYVKVLQQSPPDKDKDKDKKILKNSPKQKKDLPIYKDGKITQGTLTEDLVEKTVGEKEEEEKDDKKIECSSVSQLRGLVTKPSYSETTIGFIRLDYLHPLCSLASVQNFSFPTSLTIYPWYSKLNETFAMRSLETVLTLLASQVGALLKFRDMEKHYERYIRRELSSELQVFHDFVRKRLIELYCYTGKDRSHFLRKKMRNAQDSLTPYPQDPGISFYKKPRTKPRRERTSSKSVTTEIEDKSTSTSNLIPDARDGQEAADSENKSPDKASLRLKIYDYSDSDSGEQSDAEILYVNSKFRIPSAKSSVDNDKQMLGVTRKRNVGPDAATRKKSSVALIPEDYIHLLSIWFMYGLKTENK